ncbi:hypothetical protein B0T09DRAFT_390565, partial [Sordaria sp. MPI-SDFR-AT-0083]
FIKPECYYVIFDLSSSSRQAYLPVIIELLRLLLTPKHPDWRPYMHLLYPAEAVGDLVARFDALASVLPKHLSPLFSAPMRELALVLVDRTARERYCMYSPGAKGQYTNLVKHIALSGPPSSDSVSPHTQFLRDWIGQCCVEYHSSLRPFPYDVEAALIRTRWRSSAAYGLELLVANDVSEAEKKDLLDAFKEVGFLDTAKGRLTLLQKLAEGQEWDHAKRHPPKSRSNNALSIRLIEYALSSCFPAGLDSLQAMSRTDRRKILPYAGGYTGNEEILKYLLDNGLEEVLNIVTCPAPKSIGIAWEDCLVLHRAVLWGDISMVKLLLDRGARMLQDDRGKTPLLLAEDKNHSISVPGDPTKDVEGREEKAELIKAKLKERGLPQGHVDEPDEHLSEGEAPIRGRENKI